MLIDRREEIAVSRYRLRQAQEEIPVRLQGVMEDGHHPSLQIRIEIDEQVAAGDEVQPRERRIAQDAVGRENAEIADLLHQMIAPFGRTLPNMASWRPRGSRTCGTCSRSLRP